MNFIRVRGLASFLLCVQLIDAASISEFGRILNGIRPMAVDYPFVVNLELQTSYGGGGSCSGSLISSRVVLTCAHCVYEAIRMRACAGNDIFGQGSCQIVERTNLPYHDPYPYQKDFDFGFVILNFPFQGENIKPIVLNFNPVKDKEIVEVAGWSQTMDDSPQNPFGPVYLHETELEVRYSNVPAECNATDYAYCAIDPQNYRTPFIGDSGAPVFLKNGQQVGIVFAGLTNDKMWAPLYPTLIIKISNHRIRDIIVDYLIKYP